MEGMGCMEGMGGMGMGNMGCMGAMNRMGMGCMGGMGGMMGNGMGCNPMTMQGNMMAKGNSEGSTKGKGKDDAPQIKEEAESSSGSTGPGLSAPKKEGQKNCTLNPEDPDSKTNPGAVMEAAAKTEGKHAL